MFLATRTSTSPTMAPFSSTSRTRGTRIRSLMRCSGLRSGRTGILPLRTNIPPQTVDELVQADGAGVPLLPFTDGNGAGLRFARATDEHERNFAHFKVANLSRDALAAQVDFDAEALGEQPLVDFPRVGGLVLGHRDDRGLDRREPQRELAAVVLDQHAHEALEAAEDRAMDHDGGVALPVRP